MKLNWALKNMTFKPKNLFFFIKFYNIIIFLITIALRMIYYSFAVSFGKRILLFPVSYNNNFYIHDISGE